MQGRSSTTPTRGYESVIKIAGRPKRTFRAVLRWDEGALTIRLDDDADPEFWQEIVIDRDEFAEMERAKWAEAQQAAYDTAIDALKRRGMKDSNGKSAQ